MCFPRTRIRNFEPTAIAAPAAAQPTSLVRSSRHSDSDEMSALFSPARVGVFTHVSASHCVRSAAPMVTAICDARMSKSRRATP